MWYSHASMSKHMMARSVNIYLIQMLLFWRLMMYTAIYLNLKPALTQKGIFF